MVGSNKNELFFNRGKEEKTMDNLRTKFYNYLGNNLTADQNDPNLCLNFEKVISFFTNNLDFVLVNQPGFHLAYMDKKKIVESDNYFNYNMTNKMVEVKSVFCDNYLLIYNQILEELDLEENKGKHLIIYNISINAVYNRDMNPYYSFNDTMFYKTTVRYTIEDIGMHGDVLDEYKRNKKRKDIADYYNPKNAMTFKQYVSEEKEKIDNKKNYRIGQIPSFEKFMSGSVSLNE